MSSPFKGNALAQTSPHFFFHRVNTRLNQLKRQNILNFESTDSHTDADDEWDLTDDEVSKCLETDENFKDLFNNSNPYKKRFFGDLLLMFCCLYFIKLALF
jgi:hypothetical protein